MAVRLQGGCQCDAIRFEITDVFDAGYFTATGAASTPEHRCSPSFMFREPHSVCSAENWSPSLGSILVKA